MAKTDVWMPLFIGDYLADTGRLTTEQHGAYLLLLMDYWRNGPPPDDAGTLAQITHLSPDAWSITQAKLKHFFSIEDGMWRHKRVDEELAAAKENKGKAQAKARAAADARWHSANKNASGNAPSNASGTAQAMHEECPSPSPLPQLLIKASPAQAPDGAGDQSDDSSEKRKKRRGTEEDFKAARWMYGLVLNVNATAKQPNFDVWADEVRLMREIDHRTHVQICELFQWAKHDGFWCSNIQSPGKLREKWDTLTEQRARGGRKTSPSDGKFNFAGADRSGDRLAQQQTIERHGITIPDGEVDL